MIDEEKISALIAAACKPAKAVIDTSSLITLEKNCLLEAVSGDVMLILPAAVLLEFERKEPLPGFRWIAADEDSGQTGLPTDVEVLRLASRESCAVLSEDSHIQQVATRRGLPVLCAGLLVIRLIAKGRLADATGLDGLLRSYRRELCESLLACAEHLARKS